MLLAIKNIKNNFFEILYLFTVVLGLHEAKQNFFQARLIVNF